MPPDPFLLVPRPPAWHQPTGAPETAATAPHLAEHQRLAQDGMLLAQRSITDSEART